MEADLMESLTLDGNAVAGFLEEIFGAEMTASPSQCASCGYAGYLGTLLVYLHAPGVVLRCPQCKGIVLRIVKTPRAVYLDARGVECIRITLRG